jgi:hypothetical protein
MTGRGALLDSTLKDLYASISFAEGGEPQWQRMERVFHPHARLTRITPEGIEHFDLQGFRAMALEMFDCGVYTSFFEIEIARRACLFGALAHVLSIYETKRSAEARSCLARGVNSIQLLWQQDEWRVLSLLWDEEGQEQPLEVQRLLEMERAHARE